MKSLVVYYTRSGNARFVAETIAAEVGADIEEVIDQKNRKGIRGYLSGGFDARRERGTEISVTTKNPAIYDFVIVGSPLWASRATPAVTTYLRKNDLSGKKVAVFFVQGGKKPAGIEQIKALMPNSECVGELSVVNALRNREESEKQISEWCKTLIKKN